MLLCTPLSHIHRMICISIHRKPENNQSFYQWKYSFFYKGLAHHQPTISDGYTASICPGVVPCSKSALILTNSVCIQSCELRSLLVSVTLLKEFQAFLTLFIRNPLSEGRCSFFHFVLLDIYLLTGMYHQDFSNQFSPGVAGLVPIVIEISADFTVIPFSFTYSTYAVYVCPSTALAGAVPPTIV